MIGQEADALIAHPHLVGVFLTRQFGRTEACTDLDALHRVDAHQRRGQLGIELGIDRRAESRRHPFRTHLDHGADRGSLLSDIVEVALSLSGQKNGLRAISSQSHLSRSIWCGPICTSAPRTVTLGNILRAMAPAATRVAVSRAEEPPPPR